MCLQLPIRRDYLFNSFELFFFSVPLSTYAIFSQSLNGKQNTAIYSLLIIHMGLSSNLKKFKSTITGKYANFLFQLASGYGAAYCAALETSLAAYAQDFVLDVISALPICYHALLYSHLCNFRCSSDYIITFVLDTRVWFIARTTHQLVVSGSMYSCASMASDGIFYLRRSPYSSNFSILLTFCQQKAPLRSFRSVNIADFLTFCQVNLLDYLFNYPYISTYNHQRVFYLLIKQEERLMILSLLLLLSRKL